VAVVRVVVFVKVATLLHAAEIFSGAQFETRVGVSSARFFAAAVTDSVTNLVSVATMIVVSREEMTVLVTVAGGGIEVEASVMVVNARVETVVAMLEVSTGGT